MKCSTNSQGMHSFDYFSPKQTHGYGRNDVDFLTIICRTFHLLRSLLHYIADVPVYGSFNHWSVSAASLWAAQRWRTLSTPSRWYQRTAQAVDFTLFEILVHVDSRPFTQVCMLYEGEANPRVLNHCADSVLQSGPKWYASYTDNAQAAAAGAKQTNKQKRQSQLGWVGFLCQRRAFSVGRWILVVKGLGRGFDRVNTNAHVNNGPIWGRNKCTKMHLHKQLPLLR